MKLADHLNKDTKKKINQLGKPNKKRKKKEERIDWNDLMGTNNRGLRRKKGGAWGNG